ncbi:putative ribonuclease H-like domain-containing protein [Tanacetum coccineum]
MMEKLIWNNASRVNHQNSQRLTHLHPKGNFVPKAVLMKSGYKTLNTVRQNSSKVVVSVNTARPINTAYLRPTVNSARTVSNVFNRTHSHVRRPFNKFTTNKNNNLNEKVNTVRRNVTTFGSKAVKSDNKGNEANVVKASACWVLGPKKKVLDHGNPQLELQEKGVIDSGCSRHMIGNKSYLSDNEEIDGGFVAFGEDPKGGKITGKDTECVILFPDFKLLDENHVLLRVPRKYNMYSVDLKNISPLGGLTCLFANATLDESNLWHRRLGHINFKTINKLVKGNLVRGLPSKLFEINQTCVACQKGKQHRASCKTKIVSSISQPLQMLHMDLFGPTFVKSLMKKMYCLVVTDNYSRFSWVFFLATKDATSEVLKTFITSIENLIDLKVKVIRCDNGTKFKNKVMNQFCKMKGIKREFSVARTPQQNGVAERKNRTLIEAAKTMVLVIKPHNKTPYELFLGRKPALSFMRPFGCPVTILNTIDHLGKFDGKADEGFFVGYSTNSKAFRVFNSRTRIVEENLHVKFSEETPNIAGNGPNWLFDIDALTKSMNYEPVVAGNQSNGIAGTKACENAGKARVETVPGKDYILLPFLTQDPPFSSSSKDSPDAGFKPSGEEEKKDVEHLENEDSEVPNTEEPRVNQEQDESVNSTNNINTVSSTVNTASIEDNAVDENIVYGCVDDPNMPNLEEIVYLDDDEDVDAEADMTNLDTHILVSPTPTTRIHKDHPLEQIIRDIHSAPQTRRMTKSVTDHVEPKKAIQALTGPSWIEEMQDELLQFKLQKFWTLVDLPYGKRAIGTKWIYKNKKDKRGIVVRNKERLVAQGYTQEEGIDYDEVFAPVSRIEAIRLFLAYASFKDFVVYQMDVKSAFLYGKIEEEVYVCQPLGFEDSKFPNRVYKVEKTLYGLHQALRAWYESLSTCILDNRFQRDDIIFGSTKKSLCTKFEKLIHKKFQISYMGELTFFLGLQVTQKDDGIFISQDKYVDDILKKFSFSTVKTTSTPMETSKPLMKDGNAEDVDVHLYRSMIGSLMYLTSSRPDIMFAVCACARFQVTPKVSHLHAVKRIFRYLKGQPKLGLWYPKDSPFDLEAYTDCDYAGAIAISTTKAEKTKRPTKISQSSGPTTLVADETVHEERRDSIERAATTAASLDAEQDSGTIIRTQSMATLNELIPQGTGLGSGPKRQDTILGDRPAQTRFERLFKQSNDPPLSGVNTPGSGEDRLKIMELMEICTKLSDRVLALENLKTTQDLEITSLKKRVKKLEKKKKARTPQLKRRLFKVRIESSADKNLGDQEDASKQGRNIAESDQDEEISFVQEDAETQGRYDQDIDVTTVCAPISTAGMSVSTADPSTPPTITTITEDEDLTISQTLMKMRSEKSKEKAKERGSKEKSSEPANRPTRGVTMQEPSESGTRKAVPPSQHDLKDKGKAKMIEPEKPLKKKDQIKFDEEVAKRLAEELDAELEE